MLAVQNDVHSAFDHLVAQRLAYALAITPRLRSCCTTLPRLHQAADLLRQWNGDVTVDSPAAAIAVSARAEIWPLLLAPQIAAHDHLKPKDDATLKLAAALSLGRGRYGARKAALPTSPHAGSHPVTPTGTTFSPPAVFQGPSTPPTPRTIFPPGATAATTRLKSPTPSSGATLSSAGSSA